VNREDFVAVAARLFGVFVVIVGIQFVFSAIAMNREQPDTVPLVMLFGLVAIFILVVLFLWVFPLTIARKLLPVMRDSSAGLPLTGSMALTLGLTLLGVWLFAYALSDLAYWATFWARTRAIQDSELVFAPAQAANLAASIVRFVMSLVLMLGASGIRNTLLRLRHGPGAGF
jgi:hypothetical protein